MISFVEKLDSVVCPLCKLDWPDQTFPPDPTFPQDQIFASNQIFPPEPTLPQDKTYQQVNNLPRDLYQILIPPSSDQTFPEDQPSFRQACDQPKWQQTDPEYDVWASPFKKNIGIQTSCRSFLTNNNDGTSKRSFLSPDVVDDDRTNLKWDNAVDGISWRSPNLPENGANDRSPRLENDCDRSTILRSSTIAEDCDQQPRPTRAATGILRECSNHQDYQGKGTFIKYILRFFLKIL